MSTPAIKWTRRGLVAAGMGGVTLLALGALLETRPAVGAEAAPAAKPVRVSLAEAKRQVRMMNDIYVQGVLTTHQMYVLDPGTPSAIAWAKQVIGPVQAKGWPQARIFTTTDRPLHPENRPVDAFEKEAVEAFKAGKKELERVEGDTLRFATPISVVDASCLKCHVRNKVGDLLGGVSYRAFLESVSGKR